MWDPVPVVRRPTYGLRALWNNTGGLTLMVVRFANCILNEWTELGPWPEHGHLQIDYRYCTRMLALFRSWLIGVGLLAFTCVSWAADPEFLRPEQAFQVSARADGSDVVLTWQIAESYYLYRKRFKTKTDTQGAEFGDMVIPTGIVKEDEYFCKSEVYFCKSEVYRDTVSIRVPLRVSSDATEVAIAATSQGCADAGLCYPPDTRQLTLAVVSAMRVAATSALPIVQTAVLSLAANTQSAATLSATVAEAGATSEPPAAAPADPAKVKLLSNLLGLGPKKASGAQQIGRAHV